MTNHRTAITIGALTALAIITAAPGYAWLCWGSHDPLLSW